VLYGETFGAKRLVPLDGPVHLVTSFGIPILKPVFDMMDELIAGGLKANAPFTVDPRPIDYENVKCTLLQKIVFKIMYGRQKEYERQLAAVGLKNANAFTCACYLPQAGNTPQRGHRLAWAESSAVVFANSVLAREPTAIRDYRTFLRNTRQGAGIRLSHRRREEGDWLIELKTSKLPPAQVLGSAIGMKAVEDVPYISGLDAFLGTP
jgi:predicted aconitase